MALVLVLGVLACLLSWRPLKRALPFETPLAIGLVTIACFALFSADRLG